MLLEDLMAFWLNLIWFTLINLIYSLVPHKKKTSNFTNTARRNIISSLCFGFSTITTGRWSPRKRFVFWLSKSTCFVRKTTLDRILVSLCYIANIEAQYTTLAFFFFFFFHLHYFNIDQFKFYIQNQKYSYKFF